MEQYFHTLYAIKKNDTEPELWSVNQTDFFNEFRSVANIGIPFCILGLISNGILCWLLLCNIKKTRFTIYVVNMAIGNFIVLLHYFVIYLLFFVPSHASFYSQHVKVISLVFGSSTNIYFLTAISAERYIMVSCQFHPPTSQRRQLTVIICISLWSLSFCLTATEYFFCHPRYFASHIIGFLYCHTAIVLQYTINYLLFSPVMVFSTLALLIKTLKRTPTGIDISIVATVCLHLILSTFIKIIVFINYLIAFMPSSQYRRVSLILDCVDSTVCPFVYLLVGFWKREEALEPLNVLIGRGLNYEPNSNPRIQPEQEQA